MDLSHEKIAYVKKVNTKNVFAHVRQYIFHEEKDIFAPVYWSHSMHRGVNEPEIELSF